METKYSVWAFSDNIDTYNNYLIRYGNSYGGYLIPLTEKAELIKLWKQAVKRSIGSGDIALICCDKVIRSVWNFNRKITDKYIQYPCRYKKYI